MSRSFLALSAVASLVALAACGGQSNDQPPAYAGQYGQQYPQQPGQYPQQPGQYPQQPGQYPQQPGQYPQQPGQPYPQQPYPQQPQQPGQPAPQQPPAGQPQSPIPGLPFPFPGWPGTDGGGTAQPGQPGQPAGGGGGAAQPIDPNLASVATVPLMQLQQQHAPGMAKEGGVLAGNFQAGQSLEQGFQLQPNKCYTVIATSAGIQELDAKIIIMTPLPGQPPVLAQDSMSGATAVVGPSGNCFRWGFPVGANAKVVITATAGAGVAASQLYVK